ncbi:uncharacterized protein BO95DRAFT_465626 [Aspergillus brunneoviolaceus CBS 621.78]|uniref:Uncharacterized protein n=1 Tax=Aspergillus brunneoviolaceus CBS 621.78 TaxID=1450534 RepID=A0ACD1G386_9EURO|nr:hypothetical protein BO95DRAFT_465626 [Aspergillus brunneoviolaceus CBS 621.78]RAH43704.1 hypothetical protein BO95DRAFT_465626 [Aspergillus brunneoviolaceus CBS 621.78]
MAIPGVSPPKPFRDLKDLSRKSTLHASNTLITTEPGLGAAVTLTPIADIEILIIKVVTHEQEVSHREIGHIVSTGSSANDVVARGFTIREGNSDREILYPRLGDWHRAAYPGALAHSRKAPNRARSRSIAPERDLVLFYGVARAHLRYRRILKSSTRPVLCGQPLCLPIALFWLAGTPTAPSTTHWIVPISWPGSRSATAASGSPLGGFGPGVHGFGLRAESIPWLFYTYGAGSASDVLGWRCVMHTTQLYLHYNLDLSGTIMLWLQMKASVGGTMPHM